VASAGTDKQKSEEDEDSDFDPRVPPYSRLRPSWALALGASLKALGKVDQATPKAFGLGFEYQPRWVQAIGVLGLGPSLSIYPTNGLKLGSLWSVGGLVRYQARFLYGQWIVPTVAYSIDRISYRTDGASGFALQKALRLGAFLLLNPLDPDTAAESYTSLGVLRSYGFIEVTQPSGGDANVPVAARAILFGMRFEF
jgi:hypothetical protein